MTARQLLAALRPHSPAFDPGTGRYRLKPGAPPDLVGRFRVLKTGAAAILTGRAWLGLFPTGHAAELSPDALVPRGVGFLSLLPCGGTEWDRIPGAARLDSPDLFAPAGSATPPARRRPARKGARR